MELHDPEIKNTYYINKLTYGHSLKLCNNIYCISELFTFEMFSTWSRLFYEMLFLITDLQSEHFFNIVKYTTQQTFIDLTAYAF
jgi:hypothetical protein